MKYIILIFVSMCFYASIKHINFSWDATLTYAELYNLYAEASYNISNSRREEVDDLVGCVSNLWPPGDPLHDGSEDGCRAAILGEKTPRIIVVNPFKYL
jgi:hypothetical protein|tara:strand:+ start:922 stop:1218 length:297 start_codon:yes stop_codon:yes gene_type:complete